MKASRSVEFFDRQFRHQVAGGEFVLNPFEAAALPYLHGKVLDYGCGLGNLAVEAARRGCSVVALDASHAAIEHLRMVSSRGELPIRAEEVDLRSYELSGQFDSMACIGLLMFFDCRAAVRQLGRLKSHVRANGIAIVNVLVEGTTFMDMFSSDEYCLFKRGALREHFLDWDIVSCVSQEFPARDDTRKVFETVIARRPHDVLQIQA